MYMCVCGFVQKSNTAVNCLISDNGKKSVPFSYDTTFNTLCPIGFYTVKFKPENCLLFTCSYFLEMNIT